MLLSGDLLFASRVKSAVEAAGKSLYLGGQLPEGDLSVRRSTSKPQVKQYQLMDFSRLLTRMRVWSKVIAMVK